MQDPLKQGLKHPSEPDKRLCDTYSNARSTKTRIETSFLSSRQKEGNVIRMQDPLKQGLKPKLI